MSLATIPQASRWATDYLNKEILPNNISYLVQYGKVKKHGENGSTMIDLDDLKKYYESYNNTREVSWKKNLGNDLNWTLSFDNLREVDTTKHVHRLHPYKGKYIPQLVEYFIDNHTDSFKKETYFKSGDIILDPFLGSGTTIIQSLEMGIHSIGIDVSEFNCMIASCKATYYDDEYLKKAIKKLIDSLDSFEYDNKIQNFEKELLAELAKLNLVNFPGSDFKYKINQGSFNEKSFAIEKEKEFLPIYQKLLKKYSIKTKQDNSESFLDVWFMNNIRREIDHVFQTIKQEKDLKTRKMLALILSRTIRSCRATTHSDLATLKEPQITTYYCYKHKKICKPLFSIKSMLNRYAVDTLSRIREFNKLRKSVHYSVLTGDSRVINIFEKIEKQNLEFTKILKKQKIAGIFCSPPYVGQIDYHEQHAYAYDLLGFKRKDDLEIGPLYKGQGLEARKSYVQGISDVLNNCKKYFKDDYNVFLVANDKFNLYPDIAEKSGMKIVNQFKRPVLNRTERDRNPYSEIIFHFKSI
ncbi:restriction endonuclease subunit M [Candidatus Nomurabacteria bacterium RIFCSPHIGHO2_02_FULL_33_12]|uniref:Restriction endonuclease subunit M n=1 Tax=Candidatus Nomurabacteria bacterium RIFCSPLOWO2_01_FULL_33_17 TaxID=1801764 RepID=A0A1F6WN66_9BACT|nr:MAG: restriction endonuclease subunit M [Candidatus Nomurabacteria bacterium RIFCSPHIGHO2_02_FULL_33_12]OGI83320.1 MAG: restriction endonuclease subunit M [Candidatus Nomurabacteria bacterium RIFCSPLOWO2_01_FULL_33_17]